MTDDTLNGWKDIAAYVGKSVRSAQRWERELGLPTHRINTPDGQIVYARRSEIDAWRARMDRKPRGRAAMAAAEDPPAEVSPPTVGPPGPRGFLGRGIGWWLAGVTIVGLAAWGLSLVWSPPAHAALATLQLVGRNLEARDASGQVLWTHRFDSDVHIIKETHIGPSSESLVSATEGDVDGDGRQDYLVAVRSGSSPRDPAGRGDTLYAFSSDGRTLWRVSGDRTLVCGGEAYTGPWQLGPVLVSHDEASHRVWVAFKHHTWWPSFVVEVLRDGTQVPRYVQSGWIMALAQWTTPTGRWGVAGGVLNELAGASIAFFDLDGDETRLPAGDPRFSCDVSSTRTPDRVVLFPNFEVPQTEGNAYVIVNQIAIVDADLRVEVDASRVTSTVAADGRVRSLDFTDRYWFLHQELERQGRITHAADACPERAQPKELRYWTPAEGWQTQTIMMKSR